MSASAATAMPATSSMSTASRGQSSSPSSSTSTVHVSTRGDDSPEDFSVNSSSVLNYPRVSVKGGHRDGSVTPSEMDDRPSLTDTIHSLPGSNHSSNNVINNLTESADDDDSFGCPDSDVDLDHGESDDSFNSKSYSQTGQEFETERCDEFLNVPSSPTSRPRHYLVPISDDGEPDMKRKCLRTRLLAK